MAKMKSSINTSIYIFGLITFLAACSTIPILEVTYRLPPQPEKPIDGEICLRVEDNRVSQDMIGKGARDDFERFTGIMWLHLAEKEGEGTRLGAYDLKSMFQEAFKKRLARSGVKVAPEAGADQACLTLKLNTFLLDLVDRQWTLVIDYELILSRQGQVLFSQTLRGEAERVKIVGRQQANTIISELLTDIINRPYLVGIFKTLRD